MRASAARKARSILKRALEAHDRGDRATAIEEMRRAVTQKPGYADLRCKLGILYLEAGSLELAETELLEALRINPNYVEARFQTGLLLLRQDRPEKAAEHFGAAAALQPHYPDLLLCQGVAELRSGRFEAARERIEEALSLHPGFHRARHFLALTLGCLGETAASEAEMQKAWNGDPLLWRAQADLAHLALQGGDEEKAKGLFRSLLEEHPELPEAHLGMALLRRDEAETARTHLKKAVALRPDFVPAVRELARLEIGEGEFAAAESALRPALEAEPAVADLHFLLGQALEGQGRRSEAIGSFERTLALDASHREGRLALGMALLRQGDAEKGRMEMGRALRSDPGHPLARAIADPGLLEEL